MWRRGRRNELARMEVDVTPMGGMRRSGRTGSCSLSDNSIAYRMMLRFRPIAPKPVDGQAVQTDILPEKKNGRNGRVKRKYARIRRNKHYCSNRKRSTRISPVEPSTLTNEQGISSRDKSLVTLQLLPNRSDDKEEDSKNDEVRCNAEYSRNPDLRYGSQYLNDKNGYNQTIDFVDYEKKAVMQRTIRIETKVIVERVTNTCMDGIGLGFSDVDKINNIHLDPCPGFVSDFSGKIQWVNQAFKKLVSQENKEHQPTELGVQLMVKEELPYSRPSFACTVRFENAWGWHKCSRIVPCDVWRMDFGGFAWKLDIKASLSLGLQPYSEY